MFSKLNLLRHPWIVMDPKLSFVMGVSIGLLYCYVYFSMLLANSHLTIPKDSRITQTFLAQGPSKPKLYKLGENFTRIMEVVQRERQSTLRMACERLNKEDVCANETFYVQLHGLYSKTYKFSVCHIFKCGFSSWLQSILVMENYFSEQEYFSGNISGMKIINFASKEVFLKSPKDDETRTKNYVESYKIILVRNPFSRLVSAYYDKLFTRPKVDGFKSYFGRISKRIHRKYRYRRRHIEGGRKRDDGRATFEDFVNSIIHRPVINDLHWELYDKICSPCKSEYDYIAKMETLPEDIAYLKHKLNISKKHKQVFFEEKVYRTQPHVVKEYFKQIPKSKATALYEVYRKDFEMFGYDKPSWLC